MIEAVDSYYMYVAGQMNALGATVNIKDQTIAQPMGGIAEARDWPQTQPIEGALYLMILNIVPVGGVQAQIEYDYFCQWIWLVYGSDISSGQVEENRGDRYRAGMQIMQNLRNANYPGYCQKQKYSVDSGGTVMSQTVQSTYPYSSIEMVRWGQVRFMPKVDSEKSGLAYGAAAVEIRAYSDIAVAVA